MFVYESLYQIADRVLLLLCISKCVWKLITMDFMIGLPRTLVGDNVSL